MNLPLECFRVFYLNAERKMTTRPKIETSSALIVGLARNCAGVLEREVLRIDRAFDGFKEKEWLIIESDSDDVTVEILQSLKEKVKLDFVSFGHLRHKIPKRTERIAYCRNAYVRAINTNPRYQDINFVIVVDLDGVNENLSCDAVISCWKNKVDWDACFANQLGPYFDIWALRHKIWSPNDCWQQYRFLIANNLSRDKAKFSAVYSRMIKIRQNANPIRVDSAFGGLGIYKKNLFEGCIYEGLDEFGNEVCEHISAHKPMVDSGASLYIMPSLINGQWNEHTKPLRFGFNRKATLREFIINCVTVFVSREKLRKLKSYPRNL